MSQTVVHFDHVEEFGQEIFLRVMKTAKGLYR